MSEARTLEEANRRLAKIRRFVDDHISTRGMDNNWPEDWAEELEAYLDDAYCLECDRPTDLRGWMPGHFTHCSRYERRGQ